MFATPTAAPLNRHSSEVMTRPVFLRYWGSHFKSARAANVMAAEFQPLVRRDWKCHLVVERLPEDPDWMQGLEELGVEIHREARPVSKYDWKCALRVRRLCRRLGADILVCENMHLPPLFGAAMAGAPVRIWIKHAMNTSFEESLAPGWKEKLALSTRLSCALATRVITVSGAIRDELEEIGISRQKILVRPNPRRLGSGDALENRVVFRAGLGFDEDHVVITTVGHAVRVKGWDLLVRAFAQAASGDARLRLCLVGSLEHPEERKCFASLEADIARLEIKKKVIFTGHVQNVAAYLQAADLFVMPSRSEGCSYALIEALEAGLPCVATRVGVADEVIESGVNGFLVDRNDEAALADAIRKATSNDELRAVLAENACVPDSIPNLTDYGENLANDFEFLLRTAA